MSTEAVAQDARRAESLESPPMSKKATLETQKNYSNYSMSNFMRLPSLPLGDTVTGLVEFTDILRSSVEQCRLGVGDRSSGTTWVRSWDRLLEKHVVNAVSVTNTNSKQEAEALTRKIKTTFSQARVKMNEGLQGPEVLDLLILDSPSV